MKETILYENIWPSDIPSIIEDKIRIDITPSLDFKSFECDYHSIKAVNLREEIAQRQNKESLEKIKPLTIGYTGANSALIAWGGDKYKCPFIDTYKKPESKKKARLFAVDLIKAVTTNENFTEVAGRAFWCSIISKLAPEETRSINSLCDCYFKEEKDYTLPCFINPVKKRMSKTASFNREAKQYKKERGGKDEQINPMITFKKSKIQPIKKNPTKNKRNQIKIKPMLSSDGKYKYVSLIKPGKWKVQARFKGVSYRKGYFTNYEEACAAADLLALEINQRMGV